jgi:hypothetical protein
LTETALCNFAMYTKGANTSCGNTSNVGLHS